MGKSEPTYMQIRRHLEELISRNRNVPSYKLPSENQLAILFHTSRVPVKRALDDLEAEGLIVRHQGKGSFIAGKNGAEQKSLRVGIIIPRLDSVLYGALLRGIGEVFRAERVLFYAMISDDDPAREEGYIQDCIRHYDGIIVFPAVSHTYSSAFLQAALKRYPVVLAGRSFPGLNISCVCGSHYEQCYRTVNELIRLGHEHIAYIGEDGYSSPPYLERIQGYRTCMLEHFPNDHLNMQTIDYFNNPTDLNALNVAAVEEIFKKPVSALIISNNALSPVLSYLEKRNRTDVQLGLFDYPQGQAALLKVQNYRPIFMCQDFYEVGVHAARQLLTQINEHSAPAQIPLETVFYRDMEELQIRISQQMANF